MRWSIEELVFAWNVYREYSILSWLLHLPKRMWKRLKLVLRWLFTGYAYETLWQLDKYFLRTMIFRIEKFIALKKTGYPTEFGSEADWYNILNLMLYKLRTSLDRTIENASLDFDDRSAEAMAQRLNNYIEQDRNDREALDLFCKYFYDLWD